MKTNDGSAERMGFQVAVDETGHQERRAARQARRLALIAEHKRRQEEATADAKWDALLRRAVRADRMGS